MEPARRSLDVFEYTIGWICALSVELAASIAVLDEEFSPPHFPTLDENSCYRFGRIGQHNVVLACLPAGVTGTASAAIVATQFQSTFPSIRYGLLVGIGGGAPSAKTDIRLGDVVVSKPVGKIGGVIQYDFGKTVQKGTFEQTGSLNKPPRALLSALASFEVDCHLQGNRLSPELLAIPARYPELGLTAVRPGQADDGLFKPSYEHEKGQDTCGLCSPSQLVSRARRPNNSPVVHFGLIASANQVMRHGDTREKLAKELNVLCFEMEAAGLMDIFPSLVIRGICDYADTHKNKQWQPYAAVTAAACGKKILQHMQTVVDDRRILQVPHVTMTTHEKRDGNEVVEAKSAIWISKFRDSGFGNVRNDRFFGRRDELHSIQSWYSGGVGASQTFKKQRRMVVHGLGGVGKTQLVLEWCHDVRKKYNASVFWFNAESPLQLMSQYQQLAQQIRGFASIDEQARDFVEKHGTSDNTDKALVKEWIKAHANWIMALDNYDTISHDIESFIPFDSFDPISHGRVIFTSRDGRAIGTVANYGFELKSPQSIDAEQLFLRLYSNTTSGTLVETIECHPEYSALKEIVSDLDGFPLALSQAAAYLRESQPFTFAEYLELLRTRSDREILLRFKEERPDYPECVMTTWEISMAYVTKKYPGASELLQLLGFFAPAGIEETILRNSTFRGHLMFGKILLTHRLTSRQLDELHFLKSHARIALYLGLLVSLSLVYKSETRSDHRSFSKEFFGLNYVRRISVHPLVHEWIQARLKPSPHEAARFARLCGLVLYQAYPLHAFTLGEKNSYKVSIPTTSSHLVEIVSSLTQDIRGPNTIPLEIRTLLLVHLCWEIQERVEDPNTKKPSILSVVFPLTRSANEEPLDTIQSQLFNTLADVAFLWEGKTLIRIMELLHSGLSSYSSALPWTSSRKIYTAILVNFLLGMVEFWFNGIVRGSGPLVSSDESSVPSSFYAYSPIFQLSRHEVRHSTVSALTTLLAFLSLGPERNLAELSFLKIHIKLVLAQVLLIDEYTVLSWHFFRDGITLEEVSMVDTQTALAYLTSCAKFSSIYPEDTIRIMKLATVVFRTWEKRPGPTGNPSATVKSFISSSFGRDIYSYRAEPGEKGPQVLKEIGALSNACLQCGKAWIEDVKSAETTSLPPEKLGSSLFELLAALDEARSIASDFDQNHDRYQEVERLLSANAYFLQAKYREAIAVLQEIFHAEEVLAQTKTGPDQFGDQSNTLTSLLRPNILDQTFQPRLYELGLPAFRRDTPVNAWPRWSRKQARDIYQKGIELTDCVETRDLLRLWMNCLIRLGLITTNDQCSWMVECAKITKARSAETIDLVCKLAMASLPEKKEDLSVTPGNPPKSNTTTIHMESSNRIVTKLEDDLLFEIE